MHKHKSSIGTRRHKSRGRNPNHLPVHVAQAFQKELVNLVDSLASSGGFKERYLKNELTSKYADPAGVSPEERRSAAIQKWKATEQTNQITNQRLYIGDEDFGWTTSDKLLSFAARKIKSVLGPLDYPKCLFQGNHSTGASTRVKRSPSAMIEKYTGKAHVSQTAVKHWLQFASSSKLSDQVLTVNESSVLFTVPKATEIDRVACKEPEINMFLQKSIGSHIRKNLRRAGINLNDQTVNQEMARTAVRDRMATIDLSAASDSITTMLVMRLLPYDWYSLLDDLRVKTVEIDGEVHEVEMFSSMGNGFTFELESLIFWALAHAIKFYSRCKGKISVYGDDIIVPTIIARRLARTFSWFGFRVNAKKSSWTGKFRESCGSHFYGTWDVSPFYIREPVKTKSDVIRLLNRLAYWDSREVGFITDNSILSFHQKWSNIIPRNLWGGQSFDDINSLVTGHRPREKLLELPGDPIQVDETARLTCWFTNRERSGDSAAFIPNKGVRLSFLIRTMGFGWVHDALNLGPWESSLGKDWVQLALSLNPRDRGRYVVVQQPVWLVGTTYDPWLLRPMDIPV